MKPFLLLQVRPEDAASDNEYATILKFCGLAPVQLRRVRMDHAGLPDEIEVTEYAGVIIGGGPWNIVDPEEKKSAQQKKVESKLCAFIRQIVANDVPCFGICYGLGAITVACGGIVGHTYGEKAGAADIVVSDAAGDDPLLANMPKSFRAFVGHKEAVDVLPSGAVLLASSAACPVQIYRIGRNVYAVQFHPEMDTDALMIRVDIYKDCGYFNPADAEKIKAAARAETITYPPQMLRRFAQQYGSAS